MPGPCGPGGPSLLSLRGAASGRLDKGPGACATGCVMRAANRVVEPTIRTVLAAAAGVLALGAPAPAPAADPPAPVIAEQAAPEDYVIGPLDKLSVKVFKVPDLSSDDVVVDAAGDISIPLIGDVHAAGKTSGALARDIADKLAVTYLQSPQVAVVVEDSASRKVTVEGDVKAAGVFSMKGQITMMQAIAMAGGLGDTANIHRIALIRQVNGERHVAIYDYQAIRSAKVGDPIIKGDDVIVVDSSSSRLAFKQLLQAAPLLGVLAFHAF